MKGYFRWIYFQVESALGLYEIASGDPNGPALLFFPSRVSPGRAEHRHQLWLHHHSLESQNPGFPPGSATSLWLSEKKHPGSPAFCSEKDQFRVRNATGHQDESHISVSKSSLSFQFPEGKGQALVRAKPPEDGQGQLSPNQHFTEQPPESGRQNWKDMGRMAFTLPSLICSRTLSEMKGTWN